VQASAPHRSVVSICLTVFGWRFDLQEWGCCAIAAGAIVIDNLSAFRLDPQTFRLGRVPEVEFAGCAFRHRPDRQTELAPRFSCSAWPWPAAGPPGDRAGGGVST